MFPEKLFRISVKKLTAIFFTAKSAKLFFEYASFCEKAKFAKLCVNFANFAYSDVSGLRHCG